VSNGSPIYQPFKNIKQTKTKKGQNMKFKAISTSMAVCALAVSLSGCSKSGTSTPTPPKTPKATPGTAVEAQPAASPAAAEVKQAGETAATAATQAVKNAATEVAKPAAGATAQAQGLIDKAKSFVTEKKYQDALNTLNQLAGMTLTADQQKMVDDLKAQIQKLMATPAAAEATKAVGGLLGGQK
jgi:hypothetical protein